MDWKALLKKGNQRLCFIKKLKSFSVCPKYLGLVIDCKLDWSLKALALLKKGNQQLCFIKKLKSFSFCPKLLELLYRSIVESVVTFNSL